MVRLHNADFLSKNVRKSGSQAADSITLMRTRLNSQTLDPRLFLTLWISNNNSRCRLQGEYIMLKISFQFIQFLINFNWCISNRVFVLDIFIEKVFFREY